MTFKYKLSDQFIDKISEMEEFANGATQVSVKLKNGKIYNQLLVSNSTWIIAMRGFASLPFSILDIDDVFQTDEDKNPNKRNEWTFWRD